jgi:hypothetical protein
MNLKEKAKKDMEQNSEIVNESSSTDYVKLKEGKNIIHLIAEPEMIADKFKVGICYPGCGYRGTAKYLAYAIQDGEIKKWKIPMVVFDQIAELQENSRASFEGFPMPYVLEVTAKNAGTKEVVYTVLAGQDVTLDASTIAKLNALEPMEKSIKAMQDAQKKKIDSGEISIPEQENGPGYADSIANEEPPFATPEEQAKQGLPI